MPDNETKAATLVARCHEIQVSLGLKEVPEFEAIPLLGMAVRLSLHIQGLPAIDYHQLKLVAYHFLAIPAIVLDRVIRMLADVEFVRITQEGNTIKRIVPTVPYYGAIYENLGDYAVANYPLSEPEELAIVLLEKLSHAPDRLESLRASTGADRKLFLRTVQVGTEGSYLIQRRARGRNILLSPTYFAENGSIFADATVEQGTKSIQELLSIVRAFQGYPLELITKNKQIGDAQITGDQIRLLQRLAQDGVVKPPSITTSHAGINHFIFTPRPSGAALSPTKRDIYERAMAIVSAVRQGQLLPHRYAIRSPGAVLWKLKSDLRLGKATTEATQQYSNLVHLRIARLVPVGNGFSELRIIDLPENREALDIAYSLVSSGQGSGLEIDQDARAALQRDQEYVESLISAGKLREREQLSLTDDHQQQIELLLLGGRDS
ncbi:MAG: hypothetical protein V4529_12055 [Gemmatimonadota bacterium]